MKFHSFINSYTHTHTKIVIYSRMHSEIGSLCGLISYHTQLNRGIAGTCILK